MGDNKFPWKSTKSSISPTIFCLHQKYKRLKQFILIFWMWFPVSSNHLAFLYFQRVHLMQVGINSHQSSPESLLPISSQLYNNSLVVLGFTHYTPSIQRNMFHRFVATLQWRNRFLLTLHLDHS